MSSFFDEYAPYRAFIDNGQYSHAINNAVSFLDSVQRSLPAQYQAIHKGTPFYVMGFAAFLSHDYETGAFFFDAALSEDLKNYPGATDKPSMLFMLLDDSNERHLARGLVTQINQILLELIRDYNGRGGSRSVTRNDVCNLLHRQVIASAKPHQRSLITGFISFIAEWPLKRDLIRLIDSGSREPFFMHLFKGCLLFESLLKENPKKKVSESTLGRVINDELLFELGITKVDVRQADFDFMIGSLTPNADLHECIETTGQARNTLGHNLVWTTASLNLTTYETLFKNIASACIHAISTLYH
jgi:hypothetical protein